MQFPALEPGTDVFPGAAPDPAAEHGTSHHQRALTALNDYDVDDVVVLLRISVAVAIQHAEAMTPVIRERFTRGMVRTHFCRERRVASSQLGRLPEPESRMVGRKNRHHQKTGGVEPDKPPPPPEFLGFDCFQAMA